MAHAQQTKGKRIFNTLLNVVCFFALAYVAFSFFSGNDKNTPPTAQANNAALTSQAEQVQQLEGRAAKAGAAMAIPPTTQAEQATADAENAAYRQQLAQNTAAIQPELATLLNELETMRGTKEFAELGLSANNKKGAEWKSKVEALRTRIKADATIAPQVKAAPAALLGLALEKAWRSGSTTDMEKWHYNEVQEAINWKLEE